MGSYMSRDSAAGKKFITFLAFCTGNAALLTPVPSEPAITKIFSWLTNFCAASTAFFGS
ncbi:hypothetical protein D9M68_733790 [compost metagenome]